MVTVVGEFRKTNGLLPPFAQIVETWHLLQFDTWNRDEILINVFGYRVNNEFMKDYS